MATIPTSYKNAGARGVPAFESLDTYIDSNLVAGAEPAIQQPVRILLGDSLTLEQFTVVGLSSGKLVKATYNATLASAIRPIGVLMQKAVSGASNTTIYGEVSLTGCFNAGSADDGTDSPLIWDTTYDTLAKKTTWEGVTNLQGGNLIFRKRLS